MKKTRALKRKAGTSLTLSHPPGKACSGLFMSCIIVKHKRAKPNSPQSLENAYRYQKLYRRVGCFRTFYV